MTGEGSAMVPQAFPTFAPMALAGIGKLEDTVADRSITIRLQRRLKTEEVERFDSTDADHIDNLARKAARWATDNAERVRAEKVSVPAALDDRQADNWRLLLQIASAASPETLKQAEAAAISLAARAGGDDDDGGEALQALADCKRVFEDTRTELVASWEGKQQRELIKSAKLAKHLRELKGRPWGNEEKPLSTQKLKKLLGGFGIASHRHEFGSTDDFSQGKRDRAWGYAKDQFEDIWTRYLKPDGDDEPVGDDEPEVDDAEVGEPEAGSDGGLMTVPVCSHPLKAPSDRPKPLWRKGLSPIEAPSQCAFGDGASNPATPLP